MHGTEVGRCGENDHVHAAVDDVLIRLEPHEPPIFDIHPIAGVLRELLQARCQSIGKRVTHGVQDDAFIGVQRLACRTRAPTATSDQADTQRI